MPLEVRDVAEDEVAAGVPRLVRDEGSRRTTGKERHLFPADVIRRGIRARRRREAPAERCAQRAEERGSAHGGGF